MGKLGQLGIGSEGEEISWGAVEMSLDLGSLGEIGAVRDRGVGEEMSWKAVEMRLHLGSFRKIGIERDRECGGGNQLGSSEDEVVFGKFWGNLES